MEYLRHPNRYFRQWLSAPFIYAVIFPILFADLIFELYHHICFPLYGLALVERHRYIKLDRHKLAYLTPLNRLNCLYCGYVNGFLRYASEIASRSEWYWCGIMHEPTKGFIIPPHQRHFLKYGDEKAFREYTGLVGSKKKKRK